MPCEHLFKLFVFGDNQLKLNDLPSLGHHDIFEMQRAFGLSTALLARLKDQDSLLQDSALFNEFNRLAVPEEPRPRHFGQLIVEKVPLQ